MVGSGAAYVPPLDALGLTTVVGGWEFVQLTADYTGPCCVLQRASDDDEEEFGFVGGVIDPAVEAWIDGTTAVCTTFYDQYGANDMEQTGAARPGFLLTGFNGLPCLTFNGSSQYMTANGVAASLAGTDVPFTFIGGVQLGATNVTGFYMACAATPSTAGPYCLAGAVNTGRWQSHRRDDGGTSSVLTSVSAVPSDTDPHIHRDWFRGTEIWRLIDDKHGMVGGAADVSTLNNLNTFAFGALVRTSVSNYFNGRMTGGVVITDDLDFFEGNALQRSYCSVKALDAPLEDTVAFDALWTWFNNPRVVYNDDAYYIGAIGDDAMAREYKWTPATGAMDHFPLGIVGGRDDHNNPSRVFLPDGDIAAFYQGHPSTGGFYRRTGTAGDITTFGSEVSLDASQTNTVSYSNPIYLSGPDATAMFFRGGTLGVDARFRMLLSYDDLATWSEIDYATEGAERPYLHVARNGTNRIDVLTTDGHPASKSTSLYHFYILFDGVGRTYHKSDGTEITAELPFTISEQATVIHPAANGKAWGWDIRIGSDGHPRALFARFVSDTDHRYMYARWTGSAWTTPVQIAAAGTYLYSGEVAYSGGITFKGNNPDHVYASIESGGVWEISEWRSADNGATWAKHRDLTTDSTKVNGRPYSPDGSGAVFWWYAIYTSYTDYSESTLRYAAAA